MTIDEAAFAGDDALVRDLGELGLGRNEARLYLAAFGRPAMRAAEIAEAAGVPRTKAYDALRLLVEKGLFTEEPGRVARFKAADPELAVLQLRAQAIRDETGLVEDTRLLVADLFERYYADPYGNDPFDFVELLRNSEAVTSRCEALTAGAQVEVVRARKLPPAGPRPVSEDDAKVRAGVRCRTLYERGFLDDEGFRAGLALLDGQGEIRFAERVTVGMFVVDRRTSVISLNLVGVVSGAGMWVVLEHPGLAGLLTDAFDLAWSAASPTVEPSDRRY